MTILKTVLLPLLALSSLNLSSGSVIPRWAAPVVSLPYATYQAYHNESSGLDVFLGVRYAASTEGQNRWREAQPPPDETGMGVQNATVFPPQCPQATAGGIISAAQYDPLQSVDSEDCLFVNIYAPPNAEDLPVLVWIHGGGWDHNSAREFDPTPSINYSNNSFIAVIIQYRLGAFGFLNSPLMASDNGLNAGISDAAASLRWVQKYINYFGGNKDQVTIWGQSSGGGTILHLLSAQGEPERQGEKLWSNVIMSSPYLTPMGACDSSYWQIQFDNFTASANCSVDDTALDCLRNTSTDVLKTLSHQYDSVTQAGHPSAYEPCIEGPGGYLVSNTAERLKNGNIPYSYILAGSNYNDGFSMVSTSLTPPSNFTNISAEADARLAQLLVTDFPLTAGSDDVQRALDLYPLSEFADNHARGAELYQDIIFACGVNWALDKTQNAWRYLYAVKDAIHARDNAYEFPYFYNTLSPYSPSLYGSYIGPIVSLITSNGPNNYPNLQPSNDPSWPVYSNVGEYKVLNVTATTNVSDSYIAQNQQQIGTRERCDFWAQVRIDNYW
ncbi:uncharacterized protein I303_106295 [Kwoniella dejecticola CBS 10117]|uniref:Carboxylic ester hydrolase n=1 Tax=Kwoniella dejecticola CBS 10117 TaxID=1296121 RepID=A0A1A6A1U0_9TREE|nr:uncharacterized protein I303_06315 [Kwoniella dejecticola CBS 10117]OBR84028.1 hypothetical protein I303_06315 [Kwoniella dejecticola CBS 10117]